MTRLATTFDSLRADDRKALVVYLTAGDPDFETSVAAAKQALEAGADIIEVGVPFSDPIADGPVIQQAMERALAAGGGLSRALDVVRQLRRSSEAAIVVFGYLNPLLWDGLDNSIEAIAGAGADGVLVVDVPPEESAEARRCAARHGLDWVTLIAPTTGIERAQRIARDASGFIYVVSMTGVTGGEISGVEALQPILEAIRAVTDTPTCIGFGVRNRKSAELAASAADGVVVGSAIVDALQRGNATHDGPNRVAQCVAELRAGVDAVVGRS